MVGRRLNGTWYMRTTLTLRSSSSSGPLGQAGLRAIFLSGREDVCREATDQWLRLHVDVPFDMLLMRQAKDGRPDYQVKTELFRNHIYGKYRIVAVFDDRNQVVQMWREDHGLTVLQVADGNF